MKELTKTNLNNIRISINKIIRYNEDALLGLETSPLLTKNTIYTPCAYLEFSDNIINKIHLNIRKILTWKPCDETLFMDITDELHSRFEKESFCPKELSVKNFFNSIDKTNPYIFINMGSDNGKASVVTDEKDYYDFCFNSKLLIPILTIFKTFGDENVSVTRLVTNKNVLKFSTDNVTIYATVTRKPE